MTRRLLTFTALIMLTLPAATCGNGARPEPQIITKEVRVPYDDPACARAAVDRLEAEQPTYPDTDQALRNADSTFEGAQLLVAGRLLRIAREAAIWDALRACAGR